MSTAAVTGAGGFVGRHLVARLEAAGIEVAATDATRSAEVGSGAVDVTDAVAVDAWLQSTRPEVVFHLAARTHVGESWDRPDDVFAVNVGGTEHVVRGAAAAGVRRVVVIGSAEQYGRIEPGTAATEDTPLRPLTPYGESKCTAEARARELADELGVELVRIRAFNHTGPDQAPRFFVPALAARVAGAERDGADEIVVGNLDPVRDLTDVRDIVDAYVRLAASDVEPGAYNVASGVGRTMGTIADALLALATRPLHLRVDPALVRPVDTPYLVGDPARLVAATGWQRTIELAQTLDEVLAAARARAAHAT